MLPLLLLVGSALAADVTLARLPASPSSSQGWVDPAGWTHEPIPPIPGLLSMEALVMERGRRLADVIMVSAQFEEHVDAPARSVREGRAHGWWRAFGRDSLVVKHQRLSDGGIVAEQGAHSSGLPWTFQQKNKLCTRTDTTDGRPVEIASWADPVAAASQSGAMFYVDDGEQRMAMAPLGGYFAVAPTFDDLLSPALLCLFTVFWGAGFDIIYATLDEEFDLKEGLFSFVSRFGKSRALFFSGVIHMIAFSCLAILFFSRIRTWYAAPFLLLTGFLLWIEQRKASNVELSFFRINAGLGFVVFAMIVTGALAR